MWVGIHPCTCISLSIFLNSITFGIGTCPKADIFLSVSREGTSEWIPLAEYTMDYWVCTRTFRVLTCVTPPHTARTSVREGPDTRRTESVKLIRHVLHAADRVRIILLDIKNYSDGLHHSSPTSHNSLRGTGTNAGPCDTANCTVSTGFIWVITDV
ncbi:hypothetical protein BC826DRAFT_587422 [Russula brevipes]|nr:hypothetical protein BC826DRAFT_587422 [Russula brevipes]